MRIFVKITLNSLILAKLAGDMMDLINDFRVKNNMEPLLRNATLEEAAIEQAKFMCNTQHLSHKGTQGNTLRERLSKYKAINIGENIAKQQSNNYSEVARMWIDSPEHKKNILGDFTNTGTATCVDSEGNRYWVQIFAKEISNEKLPEFEDYSKLEEFLKKGYKKSTNNKKYIVLLKPDEEENLNKPYKNYNDEKKINPYKNYNDEKKINPYKNYKDEKKINQKQPADKEINYGIKDIANSKCEDFKLCKLGEIVKPKALYDTDNGAVEDLSKKGIPQRTIVKTVTQTVTEQQPRENYQPKTVAKNDEIAELKNMIKDLKEQIQSNNKKQNQSNNKDQNQSNNNDQFNNKDQIPQPVHTSTLTEYISTDNVKKYPEIGTQQNYAQSFKRPLNSSFNSMPHESTTGLSDNQSKRDTPGENSNENTKVPKTVKFPVESIASESENSSKPSNWEEKLWHSDPNPVPFKPATQPNKIENAKISQVLSDILKNKNVTLELSPKAGNIDIDEPYSSK